MIIFTSFFAVEIDLTVVAQVLLVSVSLMVANGQMSSHDWQRRYEKALSGQSQQNEYGSATVAKALEASGSASQSTPASHDFPSTAPPIATLAPTSHIDSSAITSYTVETPSYSHSPHMIQTYSDASPQSLPARNNLAPDTQSYSAMVPGQQNYQPMAHSIPTYSVAAPSVASTPSDSQSTTSTHSYSGTTSTSQGYSNTPSLVSYSADETHNYFGALGSTSSTAASSQVFLVEPPTNQNYPAFGPDTESNSDTVPSSFQSTADVQSYKESAPSADHSATTTQGYNGAVPATQSYFGVGQASDPSYPESVPTSQGYSVMAPPNSYSATLVESYGATAPATQNYFGVGPTTHQSYPEAVPTSNSNTATAPTNGYSAIESQNYPETFYSAQSKSEELPSHQNYFSATPTVPATPGYSIPSTCQPTVAPQSYAGMGPSIQDFSAAVPLTSQSASGTHSFQDTAPSTTYSETAAKNYPQMIPANMNYFGRNPTATNLASSPQTISVTAPSVSHTAPTTPSFSTFLRPTGATQKYQEIIHPDQDYSVSATSNIQSATTSESYNKAVPNSQSHLSGGPSNGNLVVYSTDSSTAQNKAIDPITHTYSEMVAPTNPSTSPIQSYRETVPNSQGYSDAAPSTSYAHEALENNSETVPSVQRYFGVGPPTSNLPASIGSYSPESPSHQIYLIAAPTTQTYENVAPTSQLSSELTSSAPPARQSYSALPSSSNSHGGTPSVQPIRTTTYQTPMDSYSATAPKPQRLTTVTPVAYAVPLQAPSAQYSIPTATSKKANSDYSASAHPTQSSPVASFTPNGAESSYSPSDAPVDSVLAKTSFINPTGPKYSAPASHPASMVTVPTYVLKRNLSSLATPVYLPSKEPSGTPSHDSSTIYSAPSTTVTAHNTANFYFDNQRSYSTPTGPDTSRISTLPTHSILTDTSYSSSPTPAVAPSYLVSPATPATKDYSIPVHTGQSLQMKNPHPDAVPTAPSTPVPADYPVLSNDAAPVQAYVAPVASSYSAPSADRLFSPPQRSYSKPVTPPSSAPDLDVSAPSIEAPTQVQSLPHSSALTQSYETPQQFNQASQTNYDTPQRFFGGPAQNYDVLVSESIAQTMYNSTETTPSY